MVFIGAVITQRCCIVGHYGYFSNGAKRFVEACVNVGIPYITDFNTPKGNLGVTSVCTVTLHVVGFL